MNYSELIDKEIQSHEKRVDQFQNEILAESRKLKAFENQYQCKQERVAIQSLLIKISDLREQAEYHRGAMIALRSFKTKFRKDSEPIPTAPAFSRGAINIIFDGPPGPESGRFVEVETDEGQGMGIGSWVDQNNGHWSLRIGPDDEPKVNIKTTGS